MKNFNKILYNLFLGAIISMFLMSCDPTYTSKYEFYNNSDSTIFLSVKRIKDTSNNEIVNYNWRTVLAHTTYTIGEFKRIGKLRDDKLNNFKDSIYLSLDSVTNIEVKKEINNYINWKRTIVGKDLNLYLFSIHN